MASNQKLYDRVCKAADTYTTPSNAPLMEAVKEMGKVYFMEAILDSKKVCPYCDKDGQSNYTWDKNGKLTLRLPFKMQCLNCQGRHYLTDDNAKEDFLNQDHENPEDLDIFDQMNAAEFGGSDERGWATTTDDLNPDNR